MARYTPVQVRAAPSLTALGTMRQELLREDRQHDGRKKAVANQLDLIDAEIDRRLEGQDSLQATLAARSDRDIVGFLRVANQCDLAEELEACNDPDRKAMLRGVAHTYLLANAEVKNTVRQLRATGR